METTISRDQDVDRAIVGQEIDNFLQRLAEVILGVLVAL
jgi:hypothetical protein